MQKYMYNNSSSPTVFAYTAAYEEESAWLLPYDDASE